jgi:hypothetical protein
VAILCVIVAVSDWVRTYSENALLSLATTFVGVFLGGAVSAYFTRQGSRELTADCTVIDLPTSSIMPLAEAIS